MMTWLQTGLALLALALVFYGMWRAWSRPDPAFDLTRQYEKAMGALSNWETHASDTQAAVRIIPAGGEYGFPINEKQAKVCVHGVLCWYGHECGVCEDSEDGYVWQKP
jgi:hypothetical protein